MSFVSSDSNLKAPHLRRTWRNDDGSGHATVELSPGTALYFDSAADARAVAAACVEAAEALDRLAAEGTRQQAFSPVPPVPDPSGRRS